MFLYNSINVIICLASFFVAFCCIPLLMKLALYLNMLDAPDGRLKVHKSKIPYLGGLGIFFGFISGIFLLNYIGTASLNFYFFLGINLLILLGLIDDFFRISAMNKFLGQILAVLVLVLSLSLSNINFSYYQLIFSFLWIITLVNAFNLIDVMDGLATIVAINACLGLLIFSFLIKNYILLFLIMSFLGPLLAFFHYNRPNAKIYMGDTGSMFIGAFLGYISFLFLPNFNLGLNWFVFFALIYGIVFFELLALILIRTYLKIPFYLGSPHHFSIYLEKNRKLTKNQILLFVFSAGTINSILALSYYFNYISLVWLLLITLFYILFMIYFVYPFNNK